MEGFPCHLRVRWVSYKNTSDTADGSEILNNYIPGMKKHLSKYNGIFSLPTVSTS